MIYIYTYTYTHMYCTFNMVVQYIRNIDYGINNHTILTMF